MLNASNMTAASRWDGVGQLISALCIVHCVVLPLVLAFLPVALAEALEGEAVHHGLLALVVVSALAAFIPGWRRHRRRSTPVLAALGVALLAGGAFAVPEDAGEAWETGLTLAGGLVMAVAHGRNRTLCRDCCAPEGA
ncbi:MerC domain-containing protein [Pyxidicoccus fallax]|uniref:MerC domain-containing protein n=1 Tax=Pyxidicoccus fallax TaxID=394095 RepID=A0A848LYP7_9BACT|nr:MerC domain-containing protein [Pyxidicoccus fallax]NMO23215.1 MerC domain-containing protein [Pyxidicoccus fallax]NPC86075.1 MerC domain-containing protein [Pyxidicoccus fallax]